MNRTKIFASTGKPIMQSISPQLHNAAFKALGIDSVYTRLAAKNAKSALQTAKQIGMSGLNITTPYKNDFVRLMNNLDKSASGIGAVNTVRFANGKATGFNTDGNGVTGALLANGVKIKGETAVVLGAGGAAMAATHALCASGAKVTVANRTLEKAKTLAKKFGCLACSLEEKELESALDGARIIVSALSTTDRIVPKAMLRKEMTVLEAMYSKESALVSDAKAVGCTVIHGRQWLLFQGTRAFEIFTGKKAPAKEMAKALAAKPHAKKQAAMKTNIALIGFMGSGKSETAKQIAKIAGMRVIETDAQIEKKAGKTINDIFAQDGEPEFRSIERQVISESAKAKNAIISCGGGAVLDPRNVKALAKTCVLVWLWATPEECMRRISGDKSRPLLNVKDRVSIAKKIVESRLGLYAKSADLIVATEGQDIKEIAKLIIEERTNLQKFVRLVNVQIIKFTSRQKIIYHKSSQ